jgi:hypothetical protein
MNLLIVIHAADGPRSADIWRGPAGRAQREQHRFPNAAPGFISPVWRRRRILRLKLHDNDLEAT